MGDRDVVAVDRQQAGGHETLQNAAASRIGDQRRERRGSPHGDPVGTPAHEARHERPARVGVVGVERAIEGFGRLRDRSGDSSRGVVPGDSQGRSFAPHPGLDEGVRHMGKGAAPIAGIPNDDLYESGFEAESGTRGRALDRLAKAINR